MPCGCSDSSGSGEGGYLNWNTLVKYVFFRWWNADTPGSFKMTLLLLFLMAFLYEGLQSYRSRLDSWLMDTFSDDNIPDRPQRFTPSQNVIRALLHGFSYYVGQVMMMIFMAYNGYFCISLVAGRAIGYLFFAMLTPPLEKVARHETNYTSKHCCS